MQHSANLTGPSHAPYAEAWINDLYNLLFCDRPMDFGATDGAAPSPWQLALCSPSPDLGMAAQIAADTAADARVRALACHVLRAHGRGVGERVLLGVVVEVPVGGGLDTLAAYADGSVRYLGHAGQVHILEPLPTTRPAVVALMGAAGRVVSRIGPHDAPRPPAPPAGQMRMSFLVSDGRYFGQGGMQAMQRDALAGPVVDAATGLLQLVIGLALKKAA